MQDQGLYLEHYGVLGMKWGRRMTDHASKRIDRRVRKLKEEPKALRDAKDIQRQRSQMLSLKTKDGKALFTDKDIDGMVKGNQELGAKARAKADVKIGKLKAKKARLQARQDAAERAFEVLGKRKFNFAAIYGQGGATRIGAAVADGKKSFGEAFVREMGRQYVFGFLADSKFADRTVSGAHQVSAKVKSKISQLIY